VTSLSSVPMSLLIELIQSAGSPSAVCPSRVAPFTLLLIFSADYIAVIIKAEKVANLILKRKNDIEDGTRMEGLITQY
jgi:hypothetical protein